MKKYLLIVAALLLVLPASFAGGKNGGKTSKAKTTAAVPANDTEIHWMNLDEVQVAMKQHPKKVWVDVYTGWCGWCKRMDATTFRNPNVVKYMNEKFYAVKLDAEQKDSIRFMGKMYGFVPERRTNQFAIELLQEQLSYPTGVFMDNNFQGPQLIPGYQDVRGMEMILKYLGEEVYKTTPFQDFQHTFKYSWM